MHDKRKLAYIGRGFHKKYDTNKKFNGYRLEQDNPLEIDLWQKKQVAVFGKTGSGKSYLAGVLVEEIIQTIENFAVVILDPMGIFWTLDSPNTKKEEYSDWNKQLRGEDIKPRGFSNQEVWIPAGEVKKFHRDLYDRVFAIKARQLTADMLCYAFDMKITDPQMTLFQKVKEFVAEENEIYSLEDLIERIIQDGEQLHYRSASVEALVCKLEALREIGLISNKYAVNLKEMIQPNKIAILDLSRSGSETSKIIVEFFAENLLEGRKEHTRTLKQAVKENRKIPKPRDYICPTMLIVDEAHRYMTESEKLQKAYKEGRHVGFLVTAISQGVDLTKEVYSNIKHLFVGQMTYDDDIRAIKKMLSVYKTPKELGTELRSLNKGNFYYYNLDTQESRKILVRPRLTYHPADSELYDESKYFIDENNEDELAEYAERLKEEAAQFKEKLTVG